MPIVERIAVLLFLVFAMFYSLAYNLGIFGSEDRDNRGGCNADEHCNDEC